MPHFQKTILSVGKYHSPDGIVDVTPQRLRHWEKSFKRWTGAGNRVHVHFDHDDPTNEEPPIALSNSAKRSSRDDVGYMKSFRVSPDGKSADIVLDLRDPHAAKAAKRNTSRVSPVIFDEITDGNGKRYKDVIRDLDLVSHPVDTKQSDFTPHRVAASLRMSLNSKKPKIYRMAEDDSMPDDDKPNGDSSTENTPEENSVGNEGGRLKKVIEALSNMDIVLSEDTNEENFLEHLEQALLTAAAKEGEDVTDPTNTEGLEEGAPQIAAMSLEARTAFDYANRQFRLSLSQRIDDLLKEGKCTPVEAKERKETLASVRLSLDTKTGKPNRVSLEEWIESREPVPRGTFWDPETRTRMSQLTEAKPPRDLIDSVTEDEADEIVDRMFGYDERNRERRQKPLNA